MMALFRAVKLLTEKRKALQEASAEHTATANNLIRVADEISRARKIYMLREERLDRFVLRARKNGLM